MPSLRQKVTTYFRQLSFIAESRDGPRSPRKSDDDDGNFITKYLEGRMNRIFVTGPDIWNGQNPTDLPELKIGTYPTGPHTITAACTGPDDGLTGIKRSKLHLSASYADDIDFIDTIPENDCYEVRKSINTAANTTTTTTTTNNRNNHHSGKFTRLNGTRRLSNSSGAGATTGTADDQNANKTSGMRSRKNSKSGIVNMTKEVVKSTNQRNEENTNKSATTIVVSMVSSTTTGNGVKAQSHTDATTNDQNNQNLLNAKTDAVAAAAGAIKTSTTYNAQTKDLKTTTGTAITTGNSVTTAENSTNETNKLLEDTTERLLREAVSNQDGSNDGLPVDAIAGVSNWKMETECAYGISVSLYENNMLTKEPMGNPIADCYGMVVRGDAAAMAIADGVNWGDGARLAARSAVHGCLDYLDRAIFGLAHECMATNTQEVFVSLLRSLWEGHGCILEVGGALSTLTIAVVLPLSNRNGNDNYAGKYVVCACNVGDSLGYIYSKQYGVREFTQASHDITSMRDMRDALGALGPADGNKPELSNLTFSMTIIDRGDIVFLTSDGISDNFDPVVGKFAEAWTPDIKLQTTTPTAVFDNALAPKRQNKSASAIYARLHRNDASPVSAPSRPPRAKKTVSSASNSASTSIATATPAATAPSRPKYMRSQTVIEPRRLSSAGTNPMINRRANNANLVAKIPKSTSGLPLVTGPQRHALTLYRLEDLLSYGINGTFSPCASARRLCHLLIDFVRMITSARRKTLEQRELFYKLATGPDGNKREVELNRMQHRVARKRIVDSSAFLALPGKLDHATVLAYTVGSGAGNSATSQSTQLTMATSVLQSKEFKETNF